MDDLVQTIGIIGGILAVAACVILSIVFFRDEKVGGGVTFLLLSPIAFIVGKALAIFAVVVLVICFVAWVWTLDN